MREARARATVVRWWPPPVPMRLLVVEDDPQIAEFVTDGLRRAGYAVDHVSDGETALGQALDVDYDWADSEDSSVA